jgi:pimeloyl-ACP methyl ester carboxylesterase
MPFCPNSGLFYKIYQPIELNHNTNTKPKPTLLLIHGFCETHQVFTLAYNGFETLEHKIVLVDLPGHGETPANITPPTLVAWAAALEQLRNHLGVTRWKIAGHSMGGYVALAYYRLYSDRVVSLALLHSTARADSPERQDFRNRAIHFIQTEGVEPYIRSLIPGLFAPHANKDSIELLVKLGLMQSKEGLCNALVAMRDRQDSIDVLHNMSIPFFMLCGGYDSLIKADDAMQQAMLAPIATVHCLRDCGHVSMLEAPMAFYDALKFFLHYV